jgi:hypothetical protein
MAQTLAKLGTKSKATPGGPRAANEIARGLPLGRTANIGTPLKQAHQPGQLLMLDAGLHRITAADPTSFRFYMGVKCEITARAANSVTLKSTESGDTGTAPDGFATAPGDMILLGSQGRGHQEYQMVTTASSSGLLSSTNGCVVTTSETIDTARILVGEEATVLKIPAAAGADDGSSGAVVLDSVTFPTMEAPGYDVIYHLSIGVSEQPFFIGRDGDISQTGTAGRFNRQDLQVTVGGGGTWPHEVTRSIGMARPTISGSISGGLRVMQPAGVVRFAADEINHGRLNNTNSGRNHWGKSGVIESYASPDVSPNPLFDIWTGIGEESRPEFQMLNRHYEELMVPSITLVGWKYKIRPVTEAETKEMIRKAGSFRYEIIPTAFTTQGQKGDGKSGPTEGWGTWVRKNKGRKMSFEEYQRAVEQSTEQTKNILYGVAGTTDTQKGQDPRDVSRGYE